MQCSVLALKLKVLNLLKQLLIHCGFCSLTRVNSCFSTDFQFCVVFIGLIGWFLYSRLFSKTNLISLQILVVIFLYSLNRHDICKSQLGNLFMKVSQLILSFHIYKVALTVILNTRVDVHWFSGWPRKQMPHQKFTAVLSVQLIKSSDSLSTLTLFLTSFPPTFKRKVESGLQVKVACRGWVT